MFRFSTNITQIAHSIMKKHLKEGMVVIDATIGNGNDTVFLGSRIGESGKIYGFDIQEQAIEYTKTAIQKEKILSHVNLVLDSHDKISQYVAEPIDAAMYNLGYLPKGNHQIITKPHSTINSLKQTLDLLKSGGLVTIGVYYGHDGGEEEKEAVELFLQSLEVKNYSVMSIETVNRNNNPPKLFIIEKT